MTSHLVAVVSDVHFPNQHVAGWATFREWHAEHKPKLTIVLGDMLDLGMLSVYPQGSEDPVYVVDQIRLAVREINGLAAEAGRVIYVPGNHSERWEKALIGKNAQALRGAIGLSLKEQLYAQGLSPEVRWVEESGTNAGVWIGRRCLLARHGHKQAGRFGTANVSAKLLRETPGVSTIVGHHHRAQFQCQTVLGKTHFAMANPHLSGSHEYNPSPDWQRGFTAMYFYGRSRLRDCEHFTPYTVVMDDAGRFVYNGKVYGA